MFLLKILSVGAFVYFRSFHNYIIYILYFYVIFMNIATLQSNEHNNVAM
jgi:hypothetical protein